MFRQFTRVFKKRFGNKGHNINPEDIFLDATNLPGFEAARFEGRIEKPMGETTFALLKVFLALVVVTLGWKLWMLGVANGQLYAEISERNRLEHTTIFANRGAIYDRNGKELATNSIKGESDDF